eukprot:jgi/Ulvmu1/1751/UM117_0028.1
MEAACASAWADPSSHAPRALLAEVALSLSHWRYRLQFLVVLDVVAVVSLIQATSARPAVAVTDALTDGSTKAQSIRSHACGTGPPQLGTASKLLLDGRCVAAPQHNGGRFHLLHALKRKSL